MASYKIQVPTRLPAGSAFEFASYQDGSVMSLYSNPGMNVPNLSLYQCPAAAPESVCRELLDEIPPDFKEVVTVQGSRVFLRRANGPNACGQSILHPQRSNQMYRLYGG